jgi:hypothetical protein
MPTELSLGRPVNKSLAAYQAWITGMAKQLGAPADELTDKEWAAEWRAFWEDEGEADDD